jgi:sigma-B regulation protein RsbU (phosphoserine phosphatase)
MTDSAHHTRTEKLLLEAARIINSTIDYEELNSSILKLVLTAVHAEAALVFRVDHHRTDFKTRFLRTDEDQMRVFYREMGAGVASWVARYREPVILNDPADDPRVDREIEALTGVKIKSLICVPLIGKGHMIGVVEAINQVDGEFTPADMDVLTGLSNHMAVALDNAHLYRELKREVLAKDLLYEVGKKLSGTLNLSEVLEEILNSLKKLVAFDNGSVFLVDPEQLDLKSIYTVGYAKEVEDKMQLKFGQGLVGHVASTGEALIVSDVSSDSRYISADAATRSEIVVPIQLNGRLIGIINLESHEASAYDDQSLSLVTAFASQAAISIERATLHEKLIAKQKLDDQLSIARDIQRDFLPKAAPKIAGYELSGRNISLGLVGGDYYDFISIVESQTGIAIADVSGKGIPASLIAAAFRASLIAEIRNNYSIRTIVTKVNRLLCESLEPGNYVTAVYGVLDSKNHIFTFANCGHNPPILLRGDGKVEHLTEGGRILGVTADSVYNERALMLQPGEIIVFYTDGVTEVFDDREELLGLERLIELVLENRKKSAREIQSAIHEAVIEFASDHHFHDDLTSIVLKRL